jgi:nucleoside-diphosphate-sugar epimerase
MRVLVTGHHGYIGSVAAPMLQEAGHDVTGLDTFFYEGCDLGDDVFAFPTLRMDIRDISTDVLEGYDGIVHLAALSNDPLGELDEELTREINFRGTVELARKAREAGVRRFVFASSCSMYGAAATDELVTEEAPLRPLTAYAESKVRAEEALSELADSDFAPIFMRNATAYGASPRVRLDVVLNNLAAWAFTTGKVLIMSDGTPWRPLVHVRDITAAAGAALVAPIALVRNEAFNVGANDENYRVRDLAEIVRETVSGSRVEYATGASPDKRSYRVDFGRMARLVPGWAPQWTGRAGARQLLDAYRAADLKAEDVDGPRYTRVEHLRRLLDAGHLDDTLRWRVAASARAAVSQPASIENASGS